MPSSEVGGGGGGVRVSETGTCGSPKPKKEVVVDVAVESSEGEDGSDELEVEDVKMTFLAITQFSSGERND
jgi:hypothetical protein